MEPSKGSYDREQASFLKAFMCKKCGSTYHDENKPMVAKCCNEQYCLECVSTTVQGMCPSGLHQMGGVVQNFELKQQIDNLIANQSLRSQVYKREFKIGLLPEQIMTEYFNFYYFPQFKFFDLVKKVMKFYISKDESSYLRQQFLTIELRKEYYYSQVLYEMRNKLLRLDEKHYMLKSPLDDALSSSPEYRKFLARDYDLVAVELNYPLEPNYVIVEDIPNVVDINLLINLNMGKLKIPTNQVKAIKTTLVGQENSKLCHIVFDFMANHILCDKFAHGVQEQGLTVDSMQQPDSLIQLGPHRSIYYRYFYKAQRNKSSWSYHPNSIQNEEGRPQQNNYFPQNQDTDRIPDEEWRKSRFPQTKNQQSIIDQPIQTNEPRQQQQQQQYNTGNERNQRQQDWGPKDTYGRGSQQQSNSNNITPMRDDQQQKDGENFRMYGRGERNQENYGRGGTYGGGRGGSYSRGGDRDYFRSYRGQDDRNFRPRDDFRGRGGRDSAPRDDYQSGRGRGRDFGNDRFDRKDRNYGQPQVIEEEIKENDEIGQNSQQNKESGEKKNFTSLWETNDNTTSVKDVKTEEDAMMPNETPDDSQKSYGRGQSEIQNQGSSQGRGRSYGRGEKKGNQQENEDTTGQFDNRRPGRGSQGRGSERESNIQNQEEGRGRGRSQFGRGQERERDFQPRNANNNEDRGGWQYSRGQGRDNYSNNQRFDKFEGRGRGGDRQSDQQRNRDEHDDNRGRGNRKGQDHTSKWEQNDSAEQIERLSKHYEKTRNNDQEENKFEDADQTEKQIGRGRSRSGADRGRGDNGQQRQFGRGQR